MKNPLSAANVALMVVVTMFLSCGHSEHSRETTLSHQAPMVEQIAPGSYSDACKSVVFIYVSFEYTHNGYVHKIGGWGSGFVVEKDRIVTNKHVANPSKFDYWYNQRMAMKRKGDIKASTEIYAWLPGTNHEDIHGKPNYADAIPCVLEKDAPDTLDIHIAPDTTGVNMISFSTHSISINDCSMIKASRKLGVKPLKFANIEDSYKGKKLYTLGYPRGPGCFETKVVNPSVIVGWVRKVERYIRISGSTMTGNSGGPVVLENGLVVGMIQSVYKESATLGFAIKSSDMKKLLGL